MVSSYFRFQEPFVLFKCRSLYFKVTVLLVVYVHLVTVFITVLFMFLYCLFAIIAEDVKLMAKTIVKEENMRDNVQFNNPVQNVNLRW